jgi:hypothetical protein
MLNQVMTTVSHFENVREATTQANGPTFTSHHFSPGELGELWGLSADSIRRLFLHEPGVLVISEGTARGKRRYRTLRIPAPIAERVHRRLIVAAR